MIQKEKKVQETKRKIHENINKNSLMKSTQVYEL